MTRPRLRTAPLAVTAVLVTALLPPGRARAAAPCEAADSGSEERKCWELDVLPYMWFPGTFGTVAAKGRTARVHTTIKDGLDLATGGNAFTAAGYFELRHDRVFGYVDGFGGYSEMDASETVPIRRFPRLGSASFDARLKLKPAYIDFGVGYRLGRWALPGRRRPLTLGVYVGGRYYFTFTRLRASVAVNRLDLRRAADVSDTTNLADPLIGARWEVPLLDRLALDFRGDIGGFGAGSELAWNLIGQVRYWPALTLGPVQPWLVAGYRVLAFDQRVNDAEQNLETRGPFAGVGLTF